jgi:hypothetical protein
VHRHSGWTPNHKLPAVVHQPAHRPSSTRQCTPVHRVQVRLPPQPLMLIASVVPVAGTTASQAICMCSFYNMSSIGCCRAVGCAEVLLRWHVPAERHNQCTYPLYEADTSVICGAMHTLQNEAQV